MLSFFLPIIAALGVLGPVGLLITGAFLIFALTSFLKNLDEIASSQNLTTDQKAGAMKVISAVAIGANLAGALKLGQGNTTAAAMFGIMFSFISLAWMSLVEFFSALPSYKGTT